MTPTAADQEKAREIVQGWPVTHVHVVEDIVAHAIATGRAAGLEEAVREIEVADKLIEERNRVLDAFSCPVHGRCVPHALEAIDTLRTQLAAVREYMRHLPDCEAHNSGRLPHATCSCGFNLALTPADVGTRYSISWQHAPHDGCRGDGPPFGAAQEGG